MSEEYHNHPAISRSMLNDFRESRRLYEARYILKTAPRKTETHAMRIGTISHVAVLQPQRFNELISIIPNDVLASNGARSGNKWKEYKEQQNALGKVCVKEDEIEPILAMAEQVKRKVEWITSPKAIAEQPIFWIDDTGLELRALPDFILRLSNSIVALDLKTTASVKWFHKDLKDSYWLQDSHYRAALQAEYRVDVTFIFAAVEKTPPYLFKACQIGAATRQLADTKWRETLDQLAHCYATGDWSDPGEDDVQEYEFDIY